MKRALALVVAVGLVTLAVYVRQRIDDDGAAGPAAQSTKVRVVCEPAFERICRAVSGDVRIERPDRTVDSIVKSGTLDGDVWITTDAWTAIAASRPNSASLNQPWLTAPVGVIATTGPVLGGESKRIRAFEDGCEGELTWHCMLDHSPQIDIGHPPATTSAGLITVAAMAASWTGSTAFASNDLDDEFREAFRRSEQSIDRSDWTTSQTPLERILVQPARYDVVGDLGAARPVGVAVPPDLVPSKPELTYRLVAASPTGAGIDIDAARGALGPNWGPADAPPISPNGGVLDALFTLWKEASGAN